MLSAGDNIGASPLESALFHDEPTIEFLNDIGLSASAVDNHEFDEGYRELLRIQFGGCHPTDGCQFRPSYTGADFPYLGANVTFDNGEGDGVVTYGEAFGVQPFGNIMQTITLTGAKLDAVLEQQWSDARTFFLQISSTLHYTQTPSNPIGDRVSNVTVNGEPVSPTATYRVAVNFLAAGGDGFTVFAHGTDVVGGPVDLDAFVAYLQANPNLSPPPPTRATLA